MPILFNPPLCISLSSTSPPGVQAVGQVVETVRTHAALNRTIFFFSSDHGPHVELCLEGGTAAHLRGGKGDSSWEGGLRVPGIIYWPGMVAPAVSAAPVSTLDVFATVVELAGGAMPTDKVMDGRSLLPLMTGANATSPHEALFHYCGSTLMAVRYKNWKLRYYTEQLPFDNYSTVHCTNGWAHGEFFQVNLAPPTHTHTHTTPSVSPRVARGIRLPCLNTLWAALVSRRSC